MIAPTATPAEASTSAENAAYPHPYPAVQDGKRVGLALFEIFEPTLGSAIDVLDDYLQAVAVCAPGLLPDRVFKLVQTLLPRPAIAPLEYDRRDALFPRKVVGTR